MNKENNMNPETSPSESPVIPAKEGALSAQYPDPRFTLAHVSDVHLNDDGLLHGKVDTESKVKATLEKIKNSGLNIDALVFTGDLADQGSPAAYRRLAQIVSPLAAELGAETIWVPGNHDERVAFGTELLDLEHPNTGEGEGPQESQAVHDTLEEVPPLDRVVDVNGLRIIVLDTSVPGHHHGELSAQQLAWLETQLETPARYGTILALHHPPIPVRNRLAALTELRNQAELERVLRGSDVREILAGHLHTALSGTFAGIPVHVAAGTCYTHDFATPANISRGVNADQGFSLIDVYDDRVISTPVSIEQGNTMYELSFEDLLAHMQH